jgi:hypothetical protein
VAGLETRMARRGQPTSHRLCERLSRHPGVRRHQQLDQTLLARRGERFLVAVEHGFERLLSLPLGVLRGERLDAVERKRELEFLELSLHWSRDASTFDTGVGPEAGRLVAGSDQGIVMVQVPISCHGFPPAKFTAAESLNITAVDVGAVAFTNRVAPVE